MLHAVEAPLLKIAAVAGAAVLVGMTAMAPDPVTQTLRLHAPKRCGAVYATKWAHGDVKVTLPDGEPRTMVFKTRDKMWGCEWLTTETLVPDGPNRYKYSYDEEKLSCEEDAPYSITTPRTGYVVVVR